MASPSGTSSGVIPGSELGLRGGLADRGGPEEGKEDDLEPRVRMRKQEHLHNLPDQVAQLSKEKTPDRDQHQHHLTGTALLEAENSVLRAQAGELSHWLESLDEIIEFLNASNGALDLGFPTMPRS